MRCRLALIAVATAGCHSNASPPTTLPTPLGPPPPAAVALQGHLSAEDRLTMILPGETEAGSAGMQPC